MQNHEKGTSRYWQQVGETTIGIDPGIGKETEAAYRRGWQQSWGIAIHLVEAMGKAGLDMDAIVTLLAIAEEKIIAPWRAGKLEEQDTPNINLKHLLALHEKEQQDNEDDNTQEEEALDAIM